MGDCYFKAGRAQNDGHKADPNEVPENNAGANSQKKYPPSPQNTGKLDYKSDDSESAKKFEVATKEELLVLAKKQEKALTRYKTKFSEVMISFSIFHLHVLTWLARYNHSYKQQCWWPGMN